MIFGFLGQFPIENMLSEYIFQQFYTADQQFKKTKFRSCNSRDTKFSKFSKFLYKSLKSTKIVVYLTNFYGKFPEESDADKYSTIRGDPKPHNSRNQKQAYT